MRARDIAAFVGLAWAAGLAWEHVPAGLAASALRAGANLAAVLAIGAAGLFAALVVLGLVLRALVRAVR